MLGLPICVRTLSSHCRGPCRWISIQHGVEVTSCLWYSAPQPFTKDILEGNIFSLAVSLKAMIYPPYCTHFCQLINSLKSMID